MKPTGTVGAATAVELARASRDLDALFDRRFWAGAIRVAQVYDDMASSFYVETRLGLTCSDQTDLLIAIDRDRRDALAGLAERRASTPLGRVSREWSRPGSGIERSVSALWLEFDHVESKAIDGRAPSISLCVVPNYAGRDSGAQVSDAAEPATLVHAVETVLGHPVDEPTGRSLAAWRQDARAELIHISVMTARQPATIKIYARVRRNDLTDFLVDHGSAHSLAQLDGLIADVCPPRRVGEHLYVDSSLDASGSRPSERVGLTFTPQHLAHSDERDPGRGPLLEALVGRGLCTDQQRTVLRAWPGSELAYCERRERSALLRRWLDVKLVWTPSAGVHAKAYLGFALRWLN